MREMRCEPISLFGPAEIHLGRAFLEARWQLEQRLGVSIRFNRSERESALRSGYGTVVWSGDVVSARPLALQSHEDPEVLLGLLEQETLASLSALAAHMEQSMRRAA